MLVFGNRHLTPERRVGIESDGSGTISSRAHIKRFREIVLLQNRGTTTSERRVSKRIHATLPFRELHDLSQARAPSYLVFVYDRQAI